MLRSMTGFGQGRARAGNEELAVEIKSVNHKFCEVKLRLPRELASLESALVKGIKERLGRGAVDVLVKRQPASGTEVVPQVDMALASAYQRAYMELIRGLGLKEELRLQDIATQPGVLRIEECTADMEKAQAALGQAVEQALEGVLQMRRAEGEALEADLKARLGLIESVAQEVAALVPRSVEEYRARLEERVQELAHGLPLDPQRLVQEVAYFAERTDVAEEMTRLTSHLAQFRALMASSEPAGRKMDFLVQEMHREVNTTGAKSQHPDISSRIVILKAEVERLREQVQNVE